MKSQTSRREFLAAALAALSAVPLACGPSTEIKALKIRDDVFVEYRGKVFQIEYKMPVHGHGIDYLIKRSNPIFEDIDIIETRDLVSRLVGNQSLQTLVDGHPATIQSSTGKTLNIVYADRKYPIPRYLEASSLNELLQNTK